MFKVGSVFVCAHTHTHTHIHVCVRERVSECVCVARNPARHMLEEAEEEARRVRAYLQFSPSPPVRSRLLVTTEAQVCVCGYVCECV